MSNIEQAVQAAIDEFGDDAYKRFNHKGMAFNDESCRSNDFLLRMLSVKNVSIKPLPELFAHDVEVYGENAYLMWEKKEEGVDSNYITFASNNHASDYIREIDENGNGNIFGAFHVRLKTSAALPFDLERAKAGDMVAQFKSW